MKGGENVELKAKKNFIDKSINKEYKKNDVIKVDEKRGKELLRSPYGVVEEVKRENKKEEKASVEK